MAQLAGTCWLIDRGDAGGRGATAHFARLRGIQARGCCDIESIPVPVREQTLIAIGTAGLHRLSAGARQHLADLVDQGASVYVRGLPGRGKALDLAPFARATVTIARPSRALGYRFTASEMLPAVLTGEEADQCELRAHGAEHVPAPAEELLQVRHVDGKQRAAIFGLRHGKGQVIYDMHSNGEDGAESPLVERIANPQTRHQDIGALLAADYAINRDPRRLPSFNLTIDDRPVNFDHFNTRAVTALLRHIAEVCPGAHTDFAWTPRHTSPCRRYLEVMKEYPTGFVWHGFYRHVDHRVLPHPSAEFARGRRLVGEIEERFGVRMQRIMIFPFERSTAEQFRLLQAAGFLACVGEPNHSSGFDPELPQYLQCSLPSLSDRSCGFTFLYRYPMTTLTRDRMLAMATLGLPIIAYAHPDLLGLRRLSRVWNPNGDLLHFDPVLRFAASKGLPARSLEGIAIDVNTAGSSYAL